VPLARVLALVCGLVIYAVGSHWMMVNAPNHPAVVAVLFGPLLGAAGLGAVLQRQWWRLAFCVGALGVLVATVWRGGVTDIHLLYVLQHGAIHAALAWLFAHTLRPGATPLVSLMAQRVNQHYTPAVALYTRRLTAAWVIYFLAMMAVSALLYLLAPWPWWSLFCNVLTPLGAGLFFVLEYVWRRYSHPEFERISMAQAVRAYRQTTGTAAAGAVGNGSAAPAERRSLPEAPAP
jgi:uncharacterized membrane protein